MLPHLIYCDESGQRDYGPRTDKYFVVAGVVVSADDAEHLEDEIRGLKRAHWGAPDVELKSNWIRQPKERQKHYTDKFGIGLSEIDEFMKALVKWINRAPITFLAGVVDKHMMEEKYASPHYAGGVAYTLLLQRYQRLLEKRRSFGTVVFDDPSGKSPGGFEWRILLQRQHAKLRRYGCPYTGMEFEDVGAMSFADSAASAFIQIADLVSYNTFRQFRDHGDEYDDPDARRLTLYDQFRQISGRFDCGSGEVFAGYGVAKWPARSRNRWKLPEARG